MNQIKSKLVACQVCLTFFFILLFLLSVSTRPAMAALDSERIAVFNLIDKGDLASAEMAVEQMKATYSDNSDLSRQLWEVANRYEGAGAFEKAKKLSKRIAKDYPEQKYGVYAAMQISKLNIYESIDAGNFASADNALTELEEDFKDYPDVPRRVYDVAKRYEKINAMDKAKSVYSRIIQKHSDDKHYTAMAGINLGRLSILEKINAGDYASANAEISELETDFSDNQALPRTLWNIADRYDKIGKTDKSKALYNHIASNYTSDASYAAGAAIQAKRLDIFGQIDAGDYKNAGSVISQLETDFAGHKELAKRLCDMAGRYERAGSVKDSKVLYSRIVQEYSSDTKYSRLAQMRLDRQEIYERIDSGDYDSADAAISKFISAYDGHWELARRLCEIAERYELAGQRSRADAVYQNMATVFADSEPKEALQADLLIKSNEIKKLISSGDIASADAIYEQIKNDYAKSAPRNQDKYSMPLYRIADSYDKSGKIESAKQAYQLLFDQTPKGSFFNIQAKIHLGKYQIFDYIEQGQQASAKSAIDKLLSEFTINDRKHMLLFTLAQQLQARSALADSEQIRNSYAQQAIDLLENRFPNVKSFGNARAEACFILGDCYQRLENFEKAVECYQKCADEYPQYKLAWHCQFMVGRIYENDLRGSDETIIASAYKKVVTNYPNCKAAKAAQHWLTKHGYGAVNKIIEDKINDPNSNS